MQTLFPRPDPALRAGMDRLLGLIDRTFPIPGRFRNGLGRDVAALSRQLTSERGTRDDGYLGKPAELSAYLHYFLPWNVYRLSRLFSGLPLRLEEGNILVDLGSGPLTVPIALWLARPDLRALQLEIRCLDRTGKALEAGKRLFGALAADGESRWKITTIRGSLGTHILGEKAALVSAANLFNELYQDQRTPAAEPADRSVRLLAASARDDATILVVEPGVPRSGEFVSALRDAFLRQGRPPLAPCPHAGACPLSGGRRGAKWCHFAFDTDDAPPRLLALSAAAGIPKERATLSFVAVGPQTAVSPADDAAGALDLRLVSDSFPVDGGQFGRYACSALGLTLAVGTGRRMRELESGTLLRLPPGTTASGRDGKSGAALIRV